MQFLIRELFGEIFQPMQICNRDARQLISYQTYHSRDRKNCKVTLLQMQEPFQKRRLPRKVIFSPMPETAFPQFPGRYSKKFYTGRLRPEVQPLTLLYTIFSEKSPLSYTFYWTRKAALSYTLLRRLFSFF